MPRIPRNHMTVSFFHIMTQGINKEYIFETNEEKTKYLKLINSEEKNLDIIQKRLRTLMLGLSNCGLDSTQTSNADLRSILDSFFNGGKSTDSKVVLPSEF